MQFEVWAKGLATLSVDCIVLGVFEEGELPEETHGIDSASNGYLKKLLARGDFSGRTGETLLLAEVPGIEASRALLTGLGAKKSFGRRSWRRSLGAAMTANVITYRGKSAAREVGKALGFDIETLNKLTKLVSNLTQGGAAATAVSANPGDTLQYTLTATNNGAQSLATLVINDATPAFTTFVSAACPASLPPGISACSVSTQPAVGAGGALQWTFTGSLAASGSLAVTYQVKIGT